MISGKSAGERYSVQNEVLPDRYATRKARRSGHAGVGGAQLLLPARREIRVRESVPGLSWFSSEGSRKSLGGLGGAATQATFQLCSGRAWTIWRVWIEDRDDSGWLWDWLVWPCCLPVAGLRPRRALSAGRS